MNGLTSGAILLGLVALTTALGWLWRSRTGRGRAVTSSVQVTPADVGAASFGERATLLQFSTEFCTWCPATRVLLSGIAERSRGVRHLDVDLTHRADLADRFHIMQTPTTLVLDASGIVRTRIGGAPRPHAVETALDSILGSHCAEQSCAQQAV